MLGNSEALFISNMELVSKFRITDFAYFFLFWTFRTSLGRWCSMNCHTRITLSSIDHPSSSVPLLDCRQKIYSFGCFKNLRGQPPGSFKAYVKYLLFSFEMLVLRFAFLPFSLLNFSIEVFCPRLLCLIITLSFCSNLLKTCLKTFVSTTTREVIKDHMSWSRNTRNQTRNQRLNRFSIADEWLQKGALLIVICTALLFPKLLPWCPLSNEIDSYARGQAVKETVGVFAFYL